MRPQHTRPPSQDMMEDETIDFRKLFQDLGTYKYTQAPHKLCNIDIPMHQGERISEQERSCAMAIRESNPRGQDSNHAQASENE